MKKKLLVVASTFPRWKDDTNPPFVYGLSRRLTTDFDVTVLAPHYPGAKNAEVMDQVKVERFHYFFSPWEKLAGSGGILPTLKKNKLYYLLVPFFGIAEYFAILKAVKKIKPDVIHAHWILPQGFLVALSQKFHKVPFVVTTHGGDIFGLQSGLFKAMKRYTLRKAQAITVVSNAIKKEIHDTIDRRLKVKVISMGVDSTLFSPSKRDQSIKKIYGIKGPFLLFVGRLAEKKGVKYLIQAMPAVVKKYPYTKLMIIGTGPLEHELKALSEELEMTKHIIFLGAISNKDLPRYYATADIFVGPSIVTKDGDREGLGLVFVEAGLSGAYLIGSDIGGIPDIITNESLGKLVGEKSPHQITKAILDTVELRRAKPKGDVRNRLIKAFDWKNIKKEYAEVFQHV